MHQEYRRIVSGADTAVLFVHGISGTPNHFRQRIALEEMVSPGWSVYNLLLDGHGKGAEDFSRSSMEKWRSQVRRAFEDLAKNHDRVMIAAHSMGTLFALQLAAEFPEKIPSLFLLAVPLRLGIRPGYFNIMLRYTFSKLRDDHPAEMALREASGITPTPWVWKYIGWVPRLLELVTEIRRTEKLLKQVRVPCLVFQSGRDELVSGRSLEALEKIESMDVRLLRESSHFYYAPEDEKVILDAFREQTK